MRAVGIVAEYNPFHNGHAYQIARAKELANADAAVCVMSGSFVQRGAPAIADKWVRAKMALMGGADLVIELPCYYALAPAQDFAFGAVSLLEAMGCVDALCFGSECGDLQKLSAVARLLMEEPEELSVRMKHELERGAGYPAARNAALKKMGIGLSEMGGPNDILAVEYLRALHQIGSSMKPVCITRIGTGYHDTAAQGSIASATALRLMIKKGKEIAPYVPAAAFEVWQQAARSGASPVWEEAFDHAVIAGLRLMGTEALAQIRGVSEGLESRIMRAAMQTDSVEALIAAASTKRYTKARIARIVWAAMLGIRSQKMDKKPGYLRILGMNRAGMRLLAEARERAALPVVTKTADFGERSSFLFSLDCRATDLFSLGYPCKERRVGGLDFTTSPIVVE